MLFSHCSYSSKGDSGVYELKDEIVNIAKNHPQIGIGHVKVPSFLLLIKKAIEKAQDKKYLHWKEYKDLCKDAGIEQKKVRRRLK
jgi:hypothetical protein